jgi:hypothetical protein
MPSESKEPVRRFEVNDVIEVNGKIMLITELKVRSPEYNVSVGCRLVNPEDGTLGARCYFYGGNTLPANTKRIDYAIVRTVVSLVTPSQKIAEEARASRFENTGEWLPECPDQKEGKRFCLEIQQDTRQALHSIEEAVAQVDDWSDDDRAKYAPLKERLNLALSRLENALFVNRRFQTRMEDPAQASTVEPDSHD